MVTVERAEIRIELNKLAALLLLFLALTLNAAAPSAFPVVAAQFVPSQTVEVVVRGVVIACGTDSSGSCDMYVSGAGIIVKQILQSSDTCSSMQVMDQAWVAMDSKGVVTGDVRPSSWVEAYGQCEQQTNNTKWPYLIYIDWPPMYLKVIEPPGPGTLVAVLFFSLPVDDEGKRPLDVSGHDLGATLEVSYVSGGLDKVTTGRTMITVYADPGSHVSAGVQSSPSGWSPVCVWFQYRIGTQNGCTFSGTVSSDGDEIATYFTGSTPPPPPPPPEKVLVTVTSSPTGSGFVIVDGLPISTPQTYSWTIGSTHQLFANVQVGQYVFQYWSDNGGQSHTITVPNTAVVFTAYYQTPPPPPPPGTVEIVVTSTPTGSGFVTVDGKPITTPMTYGWTVGSKHILSANSPVGSYQYQGWSDLGAQSHMITVPSTSFSYIAHYVKITPPQPPCYRGEALRFLGKMASWTQQIPFVDKIFGRWIFKTPETIGRGAMAALKGTTVIGIFAAGSSALTDVVLDAFGVKDPLTHIILSNVIGALVTAAIVALLPEVALPTVILAFLFTLFSGIAIDVAFEYFAQIFDVSCSAQPQLLSLMLDKLGGRIQ